MSKPGWNYLHNATKWHYFDEGGRSLCRNWQTLDGNEDGEPEDKFGHSKNCKACERERKKQTENTPKEKP